MMLYNPDITHISDTLFVQLKPLLIVPKVTSFLSRAYLKRGHFRFQYLPFRLKSRLKRDNVIDKVIGKVRHQILKICEAMLGEV